MRKPRHTKLDDWLQWLESLHPKRIDLGLDRVRVVSENMGLHKPKHFLITVAGTNGKGSSVSWLNTLLRAEDHRVGCFTSPHLNRYNERIQIDDQFASDDDIMAAFHAIDCARGELTVSYFEFSVLAAMWLFRERQVDIAILEVGLGGRLDAANVWNADIALITQIGLDHTHILGDTRELIVAEKMAIGRPGCPMIFADPDIPDNMVDIAWRAGVELQIAGRDFSYQKQASSWSWHLGDHQFDNLSLLPHSAEFQYRNVSGVLAVMAHLPPELKPHDITINKAISQWQGVMGRFERCYIGDIPVVLDVAHNIDSAHALIAQLKNESISGRRHCIFGAMADKSIEPMLGLLGPYVHNWYFSAAETDRAMPAQELHALAASCVANAEMSYYTALNDAFEACKQHLQPNDHVLITGSFYTVAHLRQLLV